MVLYFPYKCLLCYKKIFAQIQFYLQAYAQNSFQVLNLPVKEKRKQKKKVISRFILVFPQHDKQILNKLSIT